MLMDPASNVSVPPTVVMRTRSRVPERATSPPPPVMAFVKDLNIWLETQVFPVMFISVKAPEYVLPAATEYTIIPAVELDPAVWLELNVVTLVDT